MGPNYHTYQPPHASGIFTKSQGTLEKTLLTTCLPSKSGLHILTSCKVHITPQELFLILTVTVFTFFFDCTERAIYIIHDFKCITLQNLTLSEIVCNNTQHL